MFPTIFPLSPKQAQQSATAVLYSFTSEPIIILLITNSVKVRHSTRLGSKTDFQYVSLSMYLHKAKWHLLECCKLLYILSKHIYTASLQQISNTVGKKQTWTRRHFHVDNIMKTAREKTGREPTALLFARCFHQSVHWKTESFSTSVAAFLETVNWHSTINPATVNNISDPKQLFSLFITTRKSSGGCQNLSLHK